MALSQRSNIILFVCIVTMLIIVYSRQGNNASSITYSLSNGHKNATTDDLHKSVIVQALQENPTADSNTDVKETQTLNKDGMSKSSQKDTDSSSPSGNSGVTLKQSDNEAETGKSEDVPRNVTDEFQAPQKSINVTTLGLSKSESIPTKQHSDATTYHEVSTTTGGNAERFTPVITKIVTETTAEIITSTSYEEVNDDNIAVTQVDGTMTNNDVQEVVTQIAAVEGTEVQQVTDEKVVTQIDAAEGTEVQQDLVTDATITDDKEVDRDVTIVTETVLITEVHETMTTINE